MWTYRLFAFTNKGEPVSVFLSGYKQSGVQLDHVLLPPWAKGDPREFIRAHREV